MTGRVRTILDTTIDGTQVTVQIGGRSRTLHIPAGEMAPTLQLLTDILERHKTAPGWVDNAADTRQAQQFVVDHIERIRENVTLFLDGTDGDTIPDSDWDPNEPLHIAAIVAARQVAVVLHWVASQCDDDVSAAALWADYRLIDTLQKTAGQ